MLAFYELAVLRRPKTILFLLALLLGAALLQFPKIKLDASADSLLLQGDPDLEYFREIIQRYSTVAFIVITWRPVATLLSDESLVPLDEMAEELRALKGVSSVVTVLDVPLLQSPPIGLGQVTSGDPLPSLRDENIDRAQALEEFTTHGGGGQLDEILQRGLECRQVSHVWVIHPTGLVGRCAGL